MNEAIVVHLAQVLGRPALHGMAIGTRMIALIEPPNSEMDPAAPLSEHDAHVRMAVEQTAVDQRHRRDARLQRGAERIRKAVARQTSIRGLIPDRRVDAYRHPHLRRRLDHRQHRRLVEIEIANVAGDRNRRGD